MRETVLYYEPGDKARAEALKGVLVRLGVRIKNVGAGETGQTVGFLLGRKGFEGRAEPENPALAEPLLVLDGFDDKRLEILLREMKKTGVSVPYKAVVTETNCAWLLHQLYEELAEEHEAMSR
ncbi:DUF3783 domain-containing protein [Butyricicoccus faecihominis]|uniref:DUF3783 domain-containing protein n=1 Tax=Butyricicoccus faecihominis TaxID=1712515 RepID=UPI002478CE3E|nr:DUF3783 domain-containing protein [Butyricicoccus faecihominis]MCQ5131391.1 DUF3783 domain-containing protein [Butyricicoccus faecihominis]